MSVCFIIEGRQLDVQKKVLEKNSYFDELLMKSAHSSIRVTAPDWMSFRHLESYFSYLSTSSLPPSDLLSLQKLLWISDYFSDTALQHRLISLISPLLSKDSALLFLQDSSIKLTSSPSIDSWKALYSTCKEIVGKNLRYILVNYLEAFEKLEANVACEVIEESLRWKFFISSDHGSLVERVKELRGVEGICGLLEDEERKLQGIEAKVVFEWKVRVRALESDSGESAVFNIDGCRWKLRYMCVKGRVRVSVVSAEENSGGCSVVAIYISCNLMHTKQRSGLKLLLLPLKDANSGVIFEEMLSSEDIVLEIRANVQYIYSAIVQYFIDNPEILLTEDISEFPMTCLEFLSACRSLNIKDEEILLEILCKWVDHTRIKPSEPDMQSLTDLIRWDFISIRSLIILVCKYSAIKEYSCFRTIFQSELESKLNPTITRHKPRAGYRSKLPKESLKDAKDLIEVISSTLLSIETISDPKPSNQDDLNELDFSICRQEEQIHRLKYKYSSLRASQDFTNTQIPAPKFTESAENFCRVPNRLRNSSAGNGSRKGVKPAGMNKTGKLLNTLIRKLDSRKP